MFRGVITTETGNVSKLRLFCDGSGDEHRSGIRDRALDNLERLFDSPSLPEHVDGSTTVSAAISRSTHDR